MKRYKIDDKRLKAMEKGACPEIKEMLKRGFPDAYEEEEEGDAQVTVVKIGTNPDRYSIKTDNGDFCERGR